MRATDGKTLGADADGVLDAWRRTPPPAGGRVVMGRVIGHGPDEFSWRGGVLHVDTPLRAERPATTRPATPHELALVRDAARKGQLQVHVRRAAGLADHGYAHLGRHGFVDAEPNVLHRATGRPLGAPCPSTGRPAESASA